jgi:hypothetical protein
MLNEEGAEMLGEFIRRSEPPGLVLHLGSPLPSRFLNSLLSSSSPHVKTLGLATRDTLPVEASEVGTQLAIPRSVAQIRCTASREEQEELNVWAQKLILCLEDPSKQTLDVALGWRK